MKNIILTVFIIHLVLLIVLYTVLYSHVYTSSVFMNHFLVSMASPIIYLTDLKVLIIMELENAV